MMMPFWKLVWFGCLSAAACYQQPDVSDGEPKPKPEYFRTEMACQEIVKQIKDSHGRGIYADNLIIAYCRPVELWMRK